MYTKKNGTEYVNEAEPNLDEPLYRIRTRFFEYAVTFEIDLLITSEVVAESFNAFNKEVKQGNAESYQNLKLLPASRLGIMGNKRSYDFSRTDQKTLEKFLNLLKGLTTLPDDIINDIQIELGLLKPQPVAIKTNTFWQQATDMGTVAVTSLSSYLPSFFPRISHASSETNEDSTVTASPVKPISLRTAK